MRSLSCPNAALTKPFTNDEARFCLAESTFDGPIEPPVITINNYMIYYMIYQDCRIIIHLTINTARVSKQLCITLISFFNVYTGTLVHNKISVIMVV